MHRKLAIHRPSAAIVVAVIALFVALGGVGWAQFSVPNGSVGTAQLRNNAVTSAKIANGSVGNFKLKSGSVGPRKLINNAVGVDQINANQVQARVIGTCQGAGAIATIATTGNVTCASTPPQEFGASTTTPVALGTGSGATSIVSKPLPGGSSYLVFADPNVLINNVGKTGAGLPAQQVEVDCTLAVTPSNGATVTSSVISHLLPGTSNSTTPQEGESIPLAVPAPPVAAGSTASVSCTDSFTETTAPTVKVSSSLNAVQTANNN